MKNENLINLVETFLKEDKNCFMEYIGQDLSFGRRKSVEFYGISKENDEKIVYFVTGRFKPGDKKDFFKFYEKALSLNEKSDYVNIFDYYSDDFEKNEKVDIDLCKEKGIGIILLDDKQIYEFLTQKKNNIDYLDKKDSLYRIFLKTVKKDEKDRKNYIADLIFQATYELTNKIGGKCAKFGEVYNSLFSDDAYKKNFK